MPVRAVSPVIRPVSSIGDSVRTHYYSGYSRSILLPDQSSSHLPTLRLGKDRSACPSMRLGTLRVRCLKAQSGKDLSY